MKQKTLANGDIVYCLSEKEEIKAKNNLHFFEKIRVDSIEDFNLQNLKYRIEII